MRSPASSETLIAGHSGAHHSLAQSAADGHHWVRWTDASSELAILASCHAEALDDPDDACVLFVGHEGPHDWEFDDYPAVVLADDPESLPLGAGPLPEADIFTDLK
ncbi:hypothetical protein GCM10010468_75730 [Actinocorallia longicatena]|uniref:Uncharacterized protein n=1 Tax=Actinocorallia longicatena TaxID=111803 RepID=A0ABP6QMB9_9ACTN